MADRAQRRARHRRPSVGAGFLALLVAALAIGGLPPAAARYAVAVRFRRRYGRWPSAPTARCWPSATAMARSGCGTWRPGARPARRCRRAVPYTRWRSARTARCWPAATPTPRSGCGTRRPASPADSPLQAGSAVNGVAFSPGDTLLASADAGGDIRLVEPVDRPVGRSALPGGSAVDAVGFNPDGTLLAGWVRCWPGPAVEPVYRRAGRLPVAGRQCRGCGGVQPGWHVAGRWLRRWPGPAVEPVYRPGRLPRGQAAVP